MAEATKAAKACKKLQDEFNSLERNKSQIASHTIRVNWSVVGGLSLAFAILSGIVYLRRRILRRPARVSAPALLFAFIVVIALPALILRGRLINSPKRAFRIAQSICTDTVGCCADARCAGICKMSDTPPATHTFIAMLVSAVPFLLIFAFAAVALYSVYARAARAAPSRAHREYTPTVAVFSVAVPPRPAHIAPTFSLRGVQKDGDGDADGPCAICLADLWEKDVAELPCLHRFHHNCVSDWLRKAPHPSCPLCKAPVVNDAEHPSVDAP